MRSGGLARPLGHRGRAGHRRPAGLGGRPAPHPAQPERAFRPPERAPGRAPGPHLHGRPDQGGGGVDRGRWNGAGGPAGARAGEEEGEVRLTLGAAVPSLGDVGDEDPEDDGALVAAGFASLTPIVGVREDTSPDADDLLRAALADLAGLRAGLAGLTPPGALFAGPGGKLVGVPHEIRSLPRRRPHPLLRGLRPGDRVLVYLHGLLLDSVRTAGWPRTWPTPGTGWSCSTCPATGLSDKPRQAAAHRMDAYARRVIGLLDHLEVDRRRGRGDVARRRRHPAWSPWPPERLSGMVLEMPVLERPPRSPPCSSRRSWRPPTTPPRCLRAIDRAGPPRPADPPGPARPGVRRRSSSSPRRPWPSSTASSSARWPRPPSSGAKMTMPALVIGHRVDLLHPFGDATRLAQ